MSKVRLPWRAKLPAKLQEMSVLPSPGMVLVIRSDFGKSS
jgi:hypothetical protein